MQAYEHDAADMMGERSESLQPMKIIWTACFVLFAKCKARSVHLSERSTSVQITRQFAVDGGRIQKWV